MKLSTLVILMHECFQNSAKFFTQPSNFVCRKTNPFHILRNKILKEVYFLLWHPIFYLYSKILKEVHFMTPTFHSPRPS